MADDSQPIEEPATDEPRPSRRPLVLALVGAVCLVALAAGLFAFFRSDDAGDDAVTEVTFGPEGDATSIPRQPRGNAPVLELNVNAGPAGSEVTLQGANFKTDDGARRIDLYWDSVDGQKLGTVDAPRFSVKVRIPPDAPVRNEGHFIIALQRNKSGKVVTQESVQFYVLPPR